jgi:glycosyltransferase involved in cell wall biosynthesis
MVPQDADAVAAAIHKLLADAELRAKLAAGGRRTANGYAWEPQIDKLEAFFESIAVTAPQRSAAPRG